MLWNDALKEVQAGRKVAPTRLGTGAYVVSTPGDTGSMTLHSEDAALVDWTPALSDQESNEWVVLE